MITIRQETVADYTAISSLVEDAFRTEEHSDHREHLLVDRLRHSPAYIPELALVAQESDGQIIGHILLTRITIGEHHPSLALAPVAVLPRYQGKGIGGLLIREAHKRAAEMGFGSVVLLGHKDYYPRFGYLPLSGFGIRLPFEAPDDYCMVHELHPGALNGVSGMVTYPQAFFE